MSEPVIVKAPAALGPGADDDTAPNGSFSVILSTPTLDRDGERVKAEEWQTPLPEHITFDVDHGMSVEKTIGSGRPFLNADNHLQVNGTYASTALAQMTRTLVNEGHVRSTSVTFLRKSVEAEDGTIRTTRELLNGAFVSVPANPEALVLSSKTGARNSAKDAERLQQIHDLTVINGAQCTAKHVTDPETKAAAPAPAAPPPAEDDAQAELERVHADEELHALL